MSSQLSSSFIFCLLKQTIQFLQQIIVTCLSNRQGWESNPWPLDHKSFPMTTRPSFVVLVRDFISYSSVLLSRYLQRCVDWNSSLWIFIDDERQIRFKTLQLTFPFWEPINQAIDWFLVKGSLLFSSNDSFLVGWS